MIVSQTTKMIQPGEATFDDSAFGQRNKTVSKPPNGAAARVSSYLL